MFSEVAEIALVAARLGQFLQLLKTRVILILNFTRPHAITYTKSKYKPKGLYSGGGKVGVLWEVFFVSDIWGTYFLGELYHNLLMCSFRLVVLQ